MRRRALTIGVSAFSDADDLPFMSGLVKELAEALEAVGYSCTSHPAQRLPSAELGSFVARELESAEADLVQVVHVLTHGESADGEATVYALGSDGTRHPSGDIAHWLNTAQNSGNKVTLFLLDLCDAGSLARLAWQTKLADSRLRAWVIAATEGGMPAYSGRFTQAVINVLRAAASGELDIDPTREHIPLQVVAPAIRRELNRLVREADGFHQDVTASVVDISAEVDPPFFPNPRHAPGNRDLELRASLDPGLVPFLDDLDEGLDARHFVERGAGIGQLAGFDGLIGCFAGREAQLKQLSPWLNRKDPGNLGVVTGSPGVGKSALLGVLVCAAHPKLRARTKAVWDRVAQPPYLIDDGFAAIHARQRTLTAILSSLAAQLNLGSVSSVDGLLAAIRTRAVPPVIVVDALDEADSGVAVMTELLLPLSAVARVLVGTRRYNQYAPLLQAAHVIVDLDDVDPQVLREDLYRYVSDLLGATQYRDRGAVRGAFATEVAKTLATPSDTQWGEFLVAGLYTRYLITSHPALTNPSDAERLGSAVPRTLPEVLNLDLAAHPHQPWLRPTLTALAHAKGQGMPASVLARAVAAFTTTPSSPPTHTELREAIDAARFYLRQATDTDHTTLYRLFHQGLADHLRRPRASFFDALLSSLGPSNARDWTAAEPYLLRHILEHGRDANRRPQLFLDSNFLLTANLATLEAEDAPHVRRIAEVVRHTKSTVPQTDKQHAALAFNAARANLRELALAAANPSGRKPLPWQPLWAEGRPAVAPTATRSPDKAAPTAVRFAESGRATSIACTIMNGIPTAIVASGRQLHYINLRIRHTVATSRPFQEGRLLGISTTAHGQSAVAITGTYWKTRAILDDPPYQTTLMNSLQWIRAVACSGFAGVPMYAVIATGRQLRVFELATGTLLGEPLKGHTRLVEAVACTALHGRLAAVSGGADRTVRLWDLRLQRPIGEPLTGHEGTITAVACTDLDGRQVAITASKDRTIRIWDLNERRQLGEPLHDPEWSYSRRLAVGALADGSVVAIASGSHETSNGWASGINVWDLRERRIIRSYDYPDNTAFAGCVEVDGAQVFVAAGVPGTINIHDLELQDQPGSGPTSRCAVAGDVVLVARTDGTVIRRDLAHGTVLSHIPSRGALAELRVERVAERTAAVLTYVTGECRLLDPRTGHVADAQELYRAPANPGLPSAIVQAGEHSAVAVGRQNGFVVVKGHGVVGPEHKAPVTALTALNLEGRWLLISGAADGIVHICDVWTRRLIATIDYLPGPVDQLEASANGHLLIVSGGELSCGRLRL